MNSYLLLSAIGEIDDAYILSAQERMGLSPARPARRFHRFPRMLAALITALTLIFSTFTVAMAVSEDFREAVFAFLGIRQIIVIPEYGSDPAAAPGRMSVEKAKFGDGSLIEGTCVHAPAGSHGRNGIFYICTDPVMTKSGGHFDACAEADGELIPLETRRFCRDYTVWGNDIHVEFEWAAHNGICAILSTPSPDTSWETWSLAGPPEAVLMAFQCTIPETGESTRYPVLVNWETGELTDILAGTGAEQLPHIQNAALSGDRSRLLLYTGDEELYYADLNAKQLHSVTALSGERPDQCTFAGNALACWVLEGDTTVQEKDTSFPETRSFGTYRIWTIGLDTLQRRDLFAALPATPATSHRAWTDFFSPHYFRQPDGEAAPRYPDAQGNYVLTQPEPEPAGLHFLEGFDGASHYGNLYAGTCFALEVDENRAVYVIDLENGGKTRIEGCAWPEVFYPHLAIQPSPDGRKLLIFGRYEDNADHVGVLDFDKKCYLEFAYENLNDVSQSDITWFDNDRIIVSASAIREDSGFRDYYIYKLLND